MTEMPICGHSKKAGPGRATANRRGHQEEMEIFAVVRSADRACVRHVGSRGGSLLLNHTGVLFTFDCLSLREQSIVLSAPGSSTMPARPQVVV